MTEPCTITITGDNDHEKQLLLREILNHLAFSGYLVRAEESGQNIWPGALLSMGKKKSAYSQEAIITIKTSLTGQVDRMVTE